ncbi:MAG: hypothetical protein LJE89_17460 [Deltaproteobacteria bacterium]|nr:hypothetical protein [Deltaproteobacteria bacterium]
MSSKNGIPTTSLPSGLPLPDRIRTVDISYQIVRPEEFASLGIDPRDVPVGTFVAKDHPPFLASRFGGNAYGMGIVEQRDKLGASELDFLEGLDFGDPGTLRKNYRRLNIIYRKLGLLMRFSQEGKRYFLIPINWVSHSLADIKDKVDEIERVLVKQVYQQKKERLTVGLLTAPNNLVVHEITGRMPTQKFVVIDSIDKLSEVSGPFDLMVIPKDLDDLVISLGIKGLAGSTLSQETFATYGTYVAGKIYDLLGQGCQLFVISSKPFPPTNQEVWVEFQDQGDLRNFLLFTHVFRSRKRYRGKGGSLLRVHLADFYNYLSGIFVYREDLKKVVGEQDPIQLALEEIDRLPRLNLKISSSKLVDLESRWDMVLNPFFEKITAHSKLAQSLRKDWEKNYIVEGDLPDNLQIYLGRKREPAVRLAQLEQEERASGMAGCSLALVAGYKNTFNYVLTVLRVLAEIREKRFDRLSELELNRLHNPFAAPRNRYRAFTHMKQLMKKTGQVNRLKSLLNPEGLEGSSTKVLENIEKLSLLGLSPALLREIYLIVVGHTTMGRITFGKLPEKTLKSITNQARRKSLEEVADLLRTIRLISMAEITASLGDKLTKEQGSELFSLYDEAIWIAADPQLEWETLHDQKIAALGGAQNLAVRQMLKLFNLFEYLDSWTYIADRGPFQKEALADYRPEKLEHIEQVLELIRITNEFKERFYERELFSRPYFFRKLLNCQFHGTGHIFPLLGTRAGFILLWITISGSPGSVINFNPLISYEHHDNAERLARVKKALESLAPEQLHFDFLNGIQRTLSQGRPAFIFHSGIQLRHNPVSQATEVVFIDAEDNLRKVELILQSARDQLIPEIAVSELREADRLFGELHTYHDHLLRFTPVTGVDPDSLAKQKAEIDRCCSRLEKLFAQKLLIPQRVFDTLEVIHEHCPTIGRRILTEFWELDKIKPSKKIHSGETIARYVLRCLKKFQALVTGDREALQNTDIFYQLAQQQFGPMTGESIGISNIQIDMLEEVVNRINTRADLMESLCAALIFQEIGKLPLYLEEYRSLSQSNIHGEAGAEIIRRQALLERFGMDEKKSKLTDFLVEVHGLVGHVLKGEVTLPALDLVTSHGDELLFEAFFLHSVLAAAAYSEGIMVEDLLDRFLHLRQLALSVVRGEISWQTHMDNEFIEKGKNLLSEIDMEKTGQNRFVLFSHWDSLKDEEGYRRKGEDATAIERLFRLVGLAEISFVDVQMKILDMPVSFIYHKKGLKSTGLGKFEKDLQQAIEVCQGLLGFDEEIRRQLVDKLRPAQDLLRIYGLEYVAQHLEPGTWLKLLILSFRALDRFCPENVKPWVLDFQDLGLIIDRRYQAIAEELANLPTNRLCKDGRLLSSLNRARLGIILQVNLDKAVLKVLFQDRLEIERILAKIREEDDILRLKHLYHRSLKKLRNHPYHTEDYQKTLSDSFHLRLQELIDRAMHKAQKRMRQQRSFAGIERVLDELMVLAEENDFLEEQIQLAKDMFEFNRDRLRRRRLEAIYREISSCLNVEALIKLWEKIRTELVNNRRHLGKEFEDLVTARFDEQLQTLGEN